MTPRSTPPNENIETGELIAEAWKAIDEARRELMLAAAALEDAAGLDGRNPHTSVERELVAIAGIAGLLADQIRDDIAEEPLPPPIIEQRQVEENAKTTDSARLAGRVASRELTEEISAGMSSAPTNETNDNSPSRPESHDEVTPVSEAPNPTDFLSILETLPNTSPEKPDEAITIKVRDGTIIEINDRQLEFDQNGLIVFNTLLRKFGEKIKLSDLVNAGYVHKPLKPDGRAVDACRMFFIKLRNKLDDMAGQPVIIANNKTQARTYNLSPNIIFEDLRPQSTQIHEDTKEGDNQKPEPELEVENPVAKTSVLLDSREEETPPQIAESIQEQADSEPIILDASSNGNGHRADAGDAIADLILQGLPSEEVLDAEMEDLDLAPEEPDEEHAVVQHRGRPLRARRPEVSGTHAGNIVEVDRVEGDPLAWRPQRFFEMGYQKDVRHFIPKAEKPDATHEEIMDASVPGRTISSKIDFLTRLSELTVLRYQQVGGIRQEADWADRNTALIMKCVEALLPVSSEDQLVELFANSEQLSQLFLSRNTSLIHTRAIQAYEIQTDKTVTVEDCRETVEARFLAELLAYDLSINPNDSSQTVSKVCVRAINPATVKQQMVTAEMGRY